MSLEKDFVIFGNQKSYTITFDSFGKYIFECLKKRKPDEIFGIDVSQNKSMTCGSLLEKSVALSLAFKQMPISKETVVAMLCENTLDSFVVLLGLMYLGIPVVLINFSYSIRELKHIFNISKPKLVIGSQLSLDNILTVQNELTFIETVISIDKHDPNLNKVIDIDMLSSKVTVDIDNFQPVDTNVNDTVLMCLSSGTTGLPKCVEWTNKNFIVMVDYIIDERQMNIKATDTTVSILPLFHVYGLIVYMAACVTAMKLITIKSFKPELYLESIQKYKATKLYTVPTLLNFLATNDRINNFDISSIQDILVGGAPLAEVVYKKASQRFNTASVRELFGSTEFCGLCTLQCVNDKMKSSGKLINNFTLKVIDPDTNKSLPANKIGELRFKAMSCMKSYYKNDTETRNAFDEEGFYRSGDLGYYDENENVFISGRLKEMIKHKAFQVSPNEIENVILDHPAVSDCAVFGISDEKAGEIAKACVLLRNGINITEQEIIQFVAERISSSKHLHGGVIFVQEILRTPSGKILRNKMAKLYNSK